MVEMMKTSIARFKVLAAFDYGEFEEHAWLSRIDEVHSKALSALAKESVMSRLRCWQEGVKLSGKLSTRIKCLERTVAIAVVTVAYRKLPDTDSSIIVKCRNVAIRRVKLT